MKFSRVFHGRRLAVLLAALAVCAISVCIFGPKAAFFALPAVGLAMGATTGISKGVKCTAPIATQYTWATPGADDDTFSVASGSSNPLIGIFQATTENAGDIVEVMTSGISYIKLGDTVTRGQELTSDANGNGVPVTNYPPSTGIWSGGVALMSGVAGDIISVDLEDDFLEPMEAGSITDPMMAPCSILALADAAATLTAAQMENDGIFTITPTAARALTTDTAANLVAGMAGCQVGTYFDFSIVNEAAATYAATLTAGIGITVAGAAAVAAASSGTFRAIFTNVTAGSEAVTIVRK